MVIRKVSNWGMTGLWERAKEALSQKMSIPKLESKKKASEPMRLPNRLAKSDWKSKNLDNSSTSKESVFEQIKTRQKENKEERKKGEPMEVLWMQSHFVRASTQKMNLLAHQIIGLPLDAALLQMHFSPKKLAEIVKSVLSNLKGTLRAAHQDPAFFYVKSATVGRGMYLKRLDIKARGKRGIQWRGHAFIRICVHKPDPQMLVKKMLRIKKIPREDKPILKKLDYY